MIEIGDDLQIAGRISVDGRRARHCARDGKTRRVASRELDLNWPELQSQVARANPLAGESHFAHRDDTRCPGALIGEAPVGVDDQSVAAAPYLRSPAQRAPPPRCESFHDLLDQSSLHVTKPHITVAN